ncbi:glucokinase [Cyanobium sp. HWJ4-Hawea]|nr:glucokinase [Cyanobium sp. HWJ4-Hawea]
MPDLISEGKGIVLAGDIGGTKTLLALYRSSTLELIRSQHYHSGEWADLAPMVEAFLGGDQAEAACFAVAGPVAKGQAQLTNLSWKLDQDQLAKQLGIGQLELVNDFAVLIYGLPHLRDDQRAQIRAGKPNSCAPLMVIGAGTGLGVAFGVQTASGLVAMASEASHGEFAPRTQAEWELKQWLASEFSLPRISTERVVSGTGLGLLARWLLATQAEPDHPLHLVAADPNSDLPAQVSKQAALGNPLARQALDHWIDLYGSVSGDLALATLCQGGIWLAGGTAGKLLSELQAGGFERGFLSKGRLAAVLESIPITAVIDPTIGQFSAACRARMLAA